MKQGKKYMHAVTLVIVLVVASYMIFNIAKSALGGLNTAQAVLVTASDGVNVTGFVVRQEEVIASPYSLVTATRSEGEKVAAGAEVAISHQNTQAMERYSQCQALENQLDQLELARSYQTQLADDSALNQRIVEALSQGAALTAEGSLDKAAAAYDTVKSLILRQSAGSTDAETLDIQISALRSRIAELRTTQSEGDGLITAAQAGWYSGVCDGFESLLTPESLENMTPAAFDNLWDTQAAVSGNTAGRLITSSRWYFAFPVESGVAQGLAVGQVLTVDLGSALSAQVKMTVTALNKPQGETRTLVVLRCDQSIGEISALRRQSAQLILKSYTGLQVPKEAVCYSEATGSAGVYVLDGAKAVWKNVELLYDTGSHYVVTMDTSSTSNLWPKDLILLDTRDLFDGKVVLNS